MESSSECMRMKSRGVNECECEVVCPVLATPLLGEYSWCIYIYTTYIAFHNWVVHMHVLYYLICT